MALVQGKTPEQYQKDRALAEKSQLDDKRPVGRPVLTKTLYIVRGVRSIVRHIRANSQQEAKEVFLARSSENFYNEGITVMEATNESTELV